MTLTVHFLTCNDIDRGFVHNLDHALTWADNVLVTDNHSTDGTFEYALKRGCIAAFADEYIPMTQWEELLKLSWQFIKMSVKPHTWVCNLFGDEYIDVPDINLMNYSHLYKTATAQIHHIWDRSEMLERVDDYWYPFKETRFFQYFPNEPKLDLRKDNLHPAAHTRHVMPQYTERSRPLHLDTRVYSFRYAMDLRREGLIHKEFSPMKFKDTVFDSALLMRAT